MEADKKNHTDLKIKHEDLIKTNLLIFVMLGMFLLKIHLYPSIILSTSTVAFVALFISTYERLNLNIELIYTTTELTVVIMLLLVTHYFLTHQRLFLARFQRVQQ